MTAQRLVEACLLVIAVKVETYCLDHACWLLKLLWKGAGIYGLYFVPVGHDWRRKHQRGMSAAAILQPGFSGALDAVQCRTNNVQQSWNLVTLKVTAYASGFQAAEANPSWARVGVHPGHINNHSHSHSPLESLGNLQVFRIWGKVSIQKEPTQTQREDSKSTQKDPNWLWGFEPDPPCSEAVLATPSCCHHSCGSKTAPETGSNQCVHRFIGNRIPLTPIYPNLLIWQVSSRPGTMTTLDRIYIPSRSPCILYVPCINK